MKTKKPACMYVILQTGTVDCMYWKVEKLYKNAIQPPSIILTNTPLENQLCIKQKTNVLQRDVSKGCTVLRKCLYNPEFRSRYFSVRQHKTG